MDAVRASRQEPSRRFVTGVIPPIAVCLFVAALFSVSATADSARTSNPSCHFGSRHYWGVGPNYARVDKGAFAGNCWTLWMKGGHQKRCYNLGIAGDQRIAGARGCDLRAWPPRASGWRQVLGATTGRQGGMVVMQITRRRVRYLRTRAGYARLAGESEVVATPLMPALHPPRPALAGEGALVNPDVVGADAPVVPAAEVA